MSIKWDWLLLDEGPNQMGDVISHVDTVVKAVQSKADKLGARAQSNLDTRAARRTGDSNVEVLHAGEVIDPEGTVSLLDSYVLLVDPTDENAATGIEFGFSQVRGEGDGEATYSHDGLRVISDAVDTMVARGRHEL